MFLLWVISVIDRQDGWDLTSSVKYGTMESTYNQSLIGPPQLGKRNKTMRVFASFRKARNVSTYINNYRTEVKEVMVKRYRPFILYGISCRKDEGIWKKFSVWRNRKPHHKNLVRKNYRITYMYDMRDIRKKVR